MICIFLNIMSSIGSKEDLLMFNIEEGAVFAQ